MKLRCGSGLSESFAVHAGLKLVLKQCVFKNNSRAPQSAERLVTSLEGSRSAYGRPLKMLQLMQKGASVQTMRKGFRCLRLTVFRYLSHLDNASVEITLAGATYHVESRLLAILGAKTDQLQPTAGRIRAARLVLLALPEVREHETGVQRVHNAVTVLVGHVAIGIACPHGTAETADYVAGIQRIYHPVLVGIPLASDLRVCIVVKLLPPSARGHPQQMDDERTVLRAHARVGMIGNYPGQSEAPGVIVSVGRHDQRRARPEGE